jgi:NADH-quinone oxidoreductase subunit C
MQQQTTIERLAEAIPGVEPSEFRGQARVCVPSESVFAALEFLRDQLGFDMLADLTCVDYLASRGAPGRFGLVYLLTSVDRNERLTVRTYVNDPEPTVPSAVSLWEGANWLEREVWDLFGIHFEGHPDLRRIVLPDEFTTHPLRKDYPMQGRGERHNFPVITRAEG